MVHDTNISQICSPLVLVFRLDSQIMYSNQKLFVFSVSGFQSELDFVFVLVSEIGKCDT